MNRQILFRGKRLDNNEWVYGSLMQEMYNCYISKKIDQTREAITQICVDKETVSQFTGLTDKNGVKIFENDILDNNEIVTYSNGCFMTSIGALALSVNHREIIGNIHE